jgi:hypothetical protein
MRSRFARMAALAVIFAVGMTLQPQAQTPAPGGAAPFDIVGFIDAATLTPGTNPAGEYDGFSGGGTVTVNGTTIVVPRNTLLQMPALALTWEEVFTMAPAPYGPNSGPDGEAQSGLAKADQPTPATTYEVHIQGNRVMADGQEQYVAGLMFIAQQSMNSGTGFINFIDYEKGELRVGGTIGDGSTGARVIVNDPQGKFAPKRDDDPRFTIDEENPTVRSDTGYPMCLPRFGDAATDPNCPQSNRPKGQDGSYLPSFTTDIPAGWEFMTPPDYSPTGANALLMAPFEIGDHVVYSGHLSTDEDGDFILAHAVTANIGIYTQPGTQPTYVAIDVTLMGAGGAPIVNLPQEATIRTRIEGFTTDPSSFIMLSAIDLDPCTGMETERFYDMVAVDPGGANGAVAGRWRWNPGADAFTLPPTRMLRATSINGLYMDWNTGETLTPAGLTAGAYDSPVAEFIFPENLGIGTPPVPSPFNELPFLANGSGAYYGANGGELPLGRLGQLDPWPGAAPPATPACQDGTYMPALYLPIADAGPSQSIRPGSVITLDASGSRDTTAPYPMPLSYTWHQVDENLEPLVMSDIAHRIALPPGVTPFGTQVENPRMTFAIDTFANGEPIPDGTLLRFRVEVTNCSIWWFDPTACGTSTAATFVTIAASPTETDTLTGVVATWRVARSRLDVNATSSDANAELTVVGFGEMGVGIPTGPTPVAPGGRSYTQVGVMPMPTEITVRSSRGAVATVPVTIRP